MASRRAVTLDGQSLTLADVARVARNGARVRLSREVAARLRASRATVRHAVSDDRATYGVNTGFGHLARVRIDPDHLDDLQINLIRSHAAGTGPASDAETVRALLLLRANVLTRGHSGVSTRTVEALLDLLSHDVLPVVPERGSVGASGDLAPLAHVALVLIGEGEATYRGRRRSAASALRAAGLEPVTLGPKEGLALVNGTQFAGAIGALALDRARTLLRTADVAAALTVDVLRGTWRAFDRRIHAARPHRGQRASAANLRRLLAGSTIMTSHAGCGAVQDAYSLRCAPQVHGTARDAVEHAVDVLEIEMNSSTDNPMVFAEQDDVVSGGNFHGAPVAAVLDYASIALTSLASIAERRTDRLVNPLVSGLPAFLAQEPGLESGMMMAQVASAALVSECKTLAHPASVDSIPTSASQEDHVSMAPWAARSLRGIVDRLETVIAIELLCAARALPHLRPLRSSNALERVAGIVARAADAPAGDFPPGPAVERVREAVREGRPLEAVGRAGLRLD